MCILIIDRYQSSLIQQFLADFTRSKRTFSRVHLCINKISQKQTSMRHNTVR
jgi:hypothetical protein